MSEMNPHLRAWLASFRLARRYFRYECQGFEHIKGSGPALLVGYHGRPFPLDIFLLSAKIHDELGYMLPAIWARSWGQIPGLRQMVEALDGVHDNPSPEWIEGLKAQGKHLVVCPGGTREALRPAWRGYTVEWGERRGYLRLALRHGLPIIPVAAVGVDRAWLGLNDGYQLSRWLFGHGNLPLWLAVGMGGPWPLSLPFPIRIRQKIGPPIDLARFQALCGSEDEALSAAHHHVRSRVQGLLDALMRQQ